MWEGGADWFMYMTQDNGPCYFYETRYYGGLAEMASLDDGTLTEPFSHKAERMIRTATSHAVVFVGESGTTNATIRLYINLYEMKTRWGSETSFEAVPSGDVEIGSTGQTGVATVTVPDGTFIDVTPGVGTAGSWYLYEVGFTRVQ